MLCVPYRLVFVNTLRIPPADGLRDFIPPKLIIGQGAYIPGFTEQAEGRTKGQSSLHSPRSPSFRPMSDSERAAAEAAAGARSAKESAARCCITVIHDVPGGFLAGTGASTMVGTRVCGVH